MTATLLIEIGVEELPPRAMRALADAFADGVTGALSEAGLTLGATTRYATPRRLAVAIADTDETTQPIEVEKAGPTLAIAYDDAGKPTKAAEGFARSVGMSVDALEQEDSDKGKRLVYRATEPGKPIATLVQAAVDQALKRLPIPKLMRWGDSDAAFVRPVHWVVALHGNEIVPLSVFGESAGRRTYGHRFHHPDAIDLANADDYAEALNNAWVVVDPDSRKQRIVEQVGKAASSFGGEAVIDDGLVEEVTALVEWPVGIAGRFDERFLVLPREVLISTLQEHQRYFPIENDAGGLLAGFITVANIESRDVAQVIAGNERVVRPRLSDALFFWDQDRRQGLAHNVDGLARVTFQQSLGSLADKSARIAAAGKRLADPTGASLDIVQRAATLAKADLLTEMVGEFPDLQGRMGYYYAREDGEPAEVADAIAEQYAPARAGADIAATPAGRALSLADRLDTLSGIFAIGRRPSGDKDPFGLRRAALGVLRTVIEAGLVLDLRAELAAALANQPVDAEADTLDALWMFHMERLRGYYQDQGIGSDRFEAIIGLDLVDLVDFDRRIHALDAFGRDSDAQTVCGAHKRIRNILRRNADEIAQADFNADALSESAERDLAQAYLTQREVVVDAMKANDPGRALTALSALAKPLDAFFDQVMVMAEDASVRQNRLALLGELDDLCREVADISCLSLEQSD
ncbi:Glycine--tRNA ligase beta subunit protein [Salinisphaera shabanensis E1L3A]|uniref:Glycine--tRNA ligase beta subunit n=1 Tax=Salinisphaera shabanensis E1L3A TaxID=1033802 RepID=U2G264_9GAMM|nr:glycine--tRNA ligase subunit beta [Salinisphaera shabanensis]ERJ20303.1 Glycine--tRNA ligase beta subunit protein [Salinisphaera shabanensis E1L3A]